MLPKILENRGLCSGCSGSSLHYEVPMASVGAELWVAGKPCGLGSLSAFLAWGHLEALCFLQTSLPVSSGLEETILPMHFMTFPGIAFPPASPGSMPVWEQDVKEQLSDLDKLIAQPLAAAKGATEQQRLRR